MSKPHADSRPRIHIWRTRGGAIFSFGPTGAPIRQTDVGAALATALHAIDHRPAVIIFEGEQHVRSL